MAGIFEEVFGDKPMTPPRRPFTEVPGLSADQQLRMRCIEMAMAAWEPLGKEPNRTELVDLADGYERFIKRGWTS